MYCYEGAATVYSTLIPIEYTQIYQPIEFNAYIKCRNYTIVVFLLHTCHLLNRLTFAKHLRWIICLREYVFSTRIKLYCAIVN